MFAETTAESILSNVMMGSKEMDSGALMIVFQFCLIGSVQEAVPLKMIFAFEFQP